MRQLILILGCISLCSCAAKVDRLPNRILASSQTDPAISGNGNRLALIVDKNGRASIQLRDLQNSRLLPIRYLSRYQPHSSPSLSWNGRYVAVIGYKGTRRIVIIEDLISGKVHFLRTARQLSPVRLSMSPDASKLALQFIDKGKWRIQLFDLSKIIELDIPQGGIGVRSTIN